MSLVKSSFVADKRTAPLGLYTLVTGTMSGTTTYSGSGELLTNALALSIFGARELVFIAFTPGTTINPSSKAVLAAWDNRKTAGTDQGRIHFYNLGQSPHSHAITTSGGVTLAANDHLGIVSSQLSQPGTTTTVAAGSTSGVQNSTATGPATEVAATTDLSTYLFTYYALVI